jgi:MoaA/NifB/PqqE/SkfB family radical SAM enzyme
MNKCYAPWGYFIVGLGGDVAPCCFINKGSFGNVNSQSIEQIWNGSAYRVTREKIAMGDYVGAGCGNCYLIKTENTIKSFGLVVDKGDCFSKNNKQNIAEYGEGCHSLRSRPMFYTLTVSKKCNLNCIMCWEKGGNHPDLSENVINSLSNEFVKYARSFVWVGGETFMLKPVLDFIDKFDTTTNPYLQFFATTNGTLLDESIGNRLNKFGGVNLVFSIDGATKETYEKIRRGANYENTMNNLRGCCDKTKHPNFVVSLNYVVMNSNIHEMADILKIANELGIYVSFYPVSGTHGDENIFENKLYGDRGSFDKYFELATKEAENSKHKDIIIKTLNYIKGLL